MAAGGLFGLASGIIASVAYLNVTRLGELGEPEWRTVFYFSLISTVGGLFWTLAGHPFHTIDGRGGWLLVGVGTFGALAQLCMTRAYRRGKTMVSASLAYSTVVFASVYGIWLGQDRLSPTAWIGIGLIVLLVDAPASLPARALSLGPVRFLGRISYGLYLFHLLVRNVVYHYLPAGSVYVNAAVTFAISIGLATLSWRLIESRVLYGSASVRQRKLRRRQRHRLQPARAS